MSIIFVGDLHIKNHPLYYNAQKKFLNWLLDNHKEDTILQLGDLWDSSSPRNDIESEVIGILKQFKDFRIVEGNHDKSRIKSSALLHLNHHDNITVYSDVTEVIINDYKFLMLPYLYNMEHYSELEGEYDYICCHFTNPEDAFNNEGIELKVKGQQIYGHTHVAKEYPNKIILGVPLITRNGEKGSRILKLGVGKVMSDIIPPVFFDIVDIEFGDKIENFDYLYNVKNAPSVKSVYDTYPVLNIRDSGIQVVYTARDDKDIHLNKMDSDLKKLFTLFAHEKEMEEVYITEGLINISECIGD